jgi:hypothetical protein
LGGREEMGAGRMTGLSQRRGKERRERGKEEGKEKGREGRKKNKHFRTTKSEEKAVGCGSSGTEYKALSSNPSSVSPPKKSEEKNYIGKRI